MFENIGKSLQKLFGSKQEKDILKFNPIIEQIHQFGDNLKNLSHDELRQKTTEFRERISDYLSDIDDAIENLRQQTIDSEELSDKENLFLEIDTLKKQRDQELEVILNEILPEAFAVVKETAIRFKNNSTLSVTATEHDKNLAVQSGKSYVSITGNQATWKNQWTAAGGAITWDMVHYDVQLIGGMVLHEGKIAEMGTGEGKTLVATLPAYLNGLSGLGVHVITVNDYLARRDAEWIGPIMEFLLLTIDCIDKYTPHSEQRIQAYSCDITYGTNNEFGFDYLRDNMVLLLFQVPLAQPPKIRNILSFVQVLKN